MRSCAIIPTYNHYKALPEIITRLQAAGLPILIVDDGSNSTTQEALQNLPSTVHHIRLPINQGKGKAFLEGLLWAKNQGYTHAFQIDADGQQSLDNLDSFLDLSHRNPQALISGQPIYDCSMPLARRIGRWFTHVWVWIETLSFRITDSMCGYRIYPINQTLQAMTIHRVGHRMQFDTEVMVHLFWEGVPVIMSPVRVTYPKENTSNFDVIRDNWRITKMHTKMVFKLLFNLPQILRRRPNYKILDLPSSCIHWASMKERAPLFGLFFLAFCYKLLGKKICTLIGIPIVAYYFCLNKSQRQASQNFLRMAGVTNPNSFRHFMSFFEMALDKFGAWIGYMSWDQVIFSSSETFETCMQCQKGGLLLVSHLGNMEFCRAASDAMHQKRLHILLHSKNSERYHQLLKTFNPLSSINVIEVTEVGPDTLIYLKECINKGDWVVIAGDRIPISQNGRTTLVPFLGQEASFSQGPYILASLLECPVYVSFAVRDHGKMRVFLEKLCDQVHLSRTTKEADIKRYTEHYARILERFTKDFPYQWFNFFDFWQQRS